MESLGRFRHLKVLNLVQCPDAVDDKVLAYICSNLKHLQELGFFDCDQLTDVGLTGKQNGVEVCAGLSSLSGALEFLFIILFLNLRSCQSQSLMRPVNLVFIL